MNKPMWLAGMAAAVSVPYVMLDGNVPGWLQDTRQLWRGGAESSAVAPLHASPDGTMGIAAVQPQTPVTSLEEVLQLVARPQGILSRWPQVTTVVADANMAGYRVPLITGFSPADVTGSLTCYYDARQQLRRISIVGQTRDERPLASLLAQRFRLTPEPTLQGGLLVQRQGAQLLAVLLVQFSPMLAVDAPQPDRSVWFEWNAPGGMLSAEMQAKLSGQIP